MASNAGALAFTLSAFAQGKAPAPKGPGFGATQQGAAGFDAGDINMQDGQPVDLGTVISLTKPAKAELTDDKVIVVASQCSTVFPAVPDGCGGSSEDEDTSKCPSTWANGQLPDNPQAKKGTLCVYVLNGQDIGTAVGGGQIHGVSIVAGDGGSVLGGKVVWTPETETTPSGRASGPTTRAARPPRRHVGVEGRGHAPRPSTLLRSEPRAAAAGRNDEACVISAVLAVPGIFRPMRALRRQL